MKRILMLMCMSTAVWHSYACDVCGCSSGSQYLGILPGSETNFAGLQYQFNLFRTNHPGPEAGDPEEHSKDQYHTLQAWGRFQAGKRIQIFAFVPYHMNIHEADGIRNTASGPGDLSFLVNGIVLKEKEGEEAWKQRLIAGGGLKLPTGKYTGISELDRQGLPNMQAGTGSWDVVVNANYTIRHQSKGINLDASYTLTTANKEQYKYGNRLNAGLLGFYSRKISQVTLLPQAGVRYEYTLHDYDNYSRKWLNEQSGGYMCFFTAGVQAYYKQTGARFSWQLPIAQDYGSGYVTAKEKLEASLFFLF